MVAIPTALRQCDQLPPLLEFRAVSCELHRPGFRDQRIILVTTLRDAKQYPTHPLGIP